MDRLEQVMRETVALLNDEQRTRVAEIQAREDRIHEPGEPLDPDPRWFPRVAIERCESCGAELPRKRHDTFCEMCRDRKTDRMRERLRRRRALREVDVDLASHH